MIPKNIQCIFRKLETFDIFAKQKNLYKVLIQLSQIPLESYHLKHFLNAFFVDLKHFLNAFFVDLKHFLNVSIYE